MNNINDCVIIEISGGVPYLINKPSLVNVVIIDYDNEEESKSYEDYVHIYPCGNKTDELVNEKIQFEDYILDRLESLNS